LERGKKIDGQIIFKKNRGEFGGASVGGPMMTSFHLIFDKSLRQLFVLGKEGILEGMRILPQIKYEEKDWGYSGQDGPLMKNLRFLLLNIW
jgi:hypothetical protein